MRVEPYTIGSIVHCIKRGGRGLPIYKTEADYYRCIRSLYYLNDIFFDNDWDVLTSKRNSQTIPNLKGKDKLFFRLDSWPERRPLVKILGYNLMPNHIHLILKETQEGGISMFMKKLGQSMTNHFNAKYNTKGSIFQGSYKARNVDEDTYLRYLPAYVMVKNTFELFPGGIEAAKLNFDKAWQFAIEYPFSSLPDYVTTRNSPIIDKDILGDILCDKEEFKKFSRDVIEGGKWTLEKNLVDLILEKE